MTIEFKKSNRDFNKLHIVYYSDLCKDTMLCIQMLFKELQLKKNETGNQYSPSARLLALLECELAAGAQMS
jgi:hypothetical protein